MLACTCVDATVNLSNSRLSALHLTQYRTLHTDAAGYNSLIIDSVAQQFILQFQ